MILRIVIMCLLCAWLCDIDPNKTYTWYSGIWHGSCFPINLVRSWFSDAIYKAEDYTTAYNVFYWICSISSVIACITGQHLEKDQ